MFTIILIQDLFLDYQISEGSGYKCQEHENSLR